MAEISFQTVKGRITMADLQFTFTRKQTRKLLKMLEKHEESIRAEMPDTRLGAPALSPQASAQLKHLEAKQDEVMNFIDLLEKRLNVIDLEGINFLAKHEKQAFRLGSHGKEYPSADLPDSLLDELEEHGISEDKFHEACGDAYGSGRALWNESELYTSKVSSHIDAEEQREAAMQAGMVFGCQGYNDTMGY
jgi:hypothetical protein